MERCFFLTTARTGFSKWHQSDVSLARMLWGDPDVTRYICTDGKFSLEDIEKRLSTEISNDVVFGVQYWPFFELNTGELIGCCGLRPHGENEYEIGFHLRPKFWGEGYAVEAADAVIHYAFTVLNAKKLFAGHNPNNVASQKVLRKLGFRYVGDEFYTPTGLYHPSYELKNCLTIRAARYEDAEKIGLLHYQAWMETYTGTIPEDFLATRSPEKSTTMFRESRCGNMAVAEAAGEVVGFCGWGTFRDDCMNDRTGEIYGIYLLNKYKRMYLGQKMMANATAQLKMSGYEKVCLWVLKENIDAIQFYEKQGLRYSGIHKETFLGKPFSQLLYVKEIERGTCDS